MTTKIQVFSKSRFGIDLTDAQLQYIAIVAASSDLPIRQFPRQAGLATANKVIKAYLQDGLTVCPKN